MFLKDYIESHGADCDEVVGAKLGVKPRTIKSWRLLERYPSVERARSIVKKTRGRVDYEGIYAEYR